MSQPADNPASHQTGDSQAWVRDAVQRFERPLITYAARLLGNLDTAQDVVQETFLKLCRQSPAELDGRLAEWLYAVCRNRALDIRRKEKRMQPTVINNLQTRAHGAAPPSPPDVMERQESTSRIFRAMEHLPENQQEVLRLKFQHHLSYKEIGGVMNLTANHVGVLVHNAMKTLRSQLAEAAPKV